MVSLPAKYFDFPTDLQITFFTPLEIPNIYIHISMKMVMIRNKSVNEIKNIINFEQINLH